MFGLNSKKTITQQTQQISKQSDQIQALEQQVARLTEENEALRNESDNLKPTNSCNSNCLVISSVLESLSLNFSTP